VPRWLKSSVAPAAAPHRLDALPPSTEQSARNSWEWVAADDARKPDRAESGGEQDLDRQGAAGIEAPSAPPAKRIGSLRFVFQTDPDGRFLLVSKELQDVLGAAGDWTGRTYDEVASSAGLRDAEAVRRAFQSQSTWTSLPFTWRDEEAREATRIEMSAAPLFDGGRSFLGFRGFGLCRPPLPIEPHEAASDGPALEETEEASSAGVSDGGPAPIESAGIVTAPAAEPGAPDAPESPRLPETRIASAAEHPTLRAEAEVIAIANGKVARGSADGKRPSGAVALRKDGVSGDRSCSRRAARRGRDGLAPHVRCRRRQ
jgi:hypothetical protein